MDLWAEHLRIKLCWVSRGLCFPALPELNYKLHKTDKRSRIWLARAGLEVLVKIMPLNMKFERGTEEMVFFSSPFAILVSQIYPQQTLLITNAYLHKYKMTLPSVPLGETSDAVALFIKPKRLTRAMMWNMEMKLLMTNYFKWLNATLMLQVTSVRYWLILISSVSFLYCPLNRKTESKVSATWETDIACQEPEDV